MIEMRLLRLRLFVVYFLRPRVSSLFLFNLRGAPKIDLPLSKFSLAISVLNSLFSELTLSVGETNKVVLKEAILEEEKPYPNWFYQKQFFESLASHRVLY